MSKCIGFFFCDVDIANGCYLSMSAITILISVYE